MRSSFTEQAVKVAFEVAKEIYGEDIPRDVEQRLEREVIPLTEWLSENPAGTYAEYRGRS